MPGKFFAIVNPAAGGGRCAKLAPAALARLRAAGVPVETAETRASGDATRLAREAQANGYRKFIAVGGDGTSYEIINGIFPAAAQSVVERCTLAFLPLGTGNSFLRDFLGSNHTDAAAQMERAIIKRASRACDVIHLRHSAGELCPPPAAPASSDKSPPRSPTLNPISNPFSPPSMWTTSRSNPPSPPRLPSPFRRSRPSNR